MKQQELMNQAYEKWRQNDWTQQVFWQHLDFVEKVAVYTGNLNYQVENGGFAQWIDNGYSDCATELIDILEDDIGTEAAIEIAAMIKTASKRQEYDDQECDCCTGHCWHEEDECMCECSYPDYDDLDKKFYEINQQFLVDVQEWLDRQV
jgi:hypothetical protein